MSLAEKHLSLHVVNGYPTHQEQQGPWPPSCTHWIEAEPRGLLFTQPYLSSIDTDSLLMSHHRWYAAICMLIQALQWTTDIPAAVYLLHPGGSLQSVCLLTMHKQVIMRLDEVNQTAWASVHTIPAALFRCSANNTPHSQVWHQSSCWGCTSAKWSHFNDNASKHMLAAGVMFRMLALKVCR